MQSKITTLRITQNTHNLFLQYAKTYAKYGDTVDQILSSLLQKQLQKQAPQQASKNQKNVKPAPGKANGLTLTTTQTGGVQG